MPRKKLLLTKHDIVYLVPWFYQPMMTFPDKFIVMLEQLVLQKSLSERVLFISILKNFINSRDSHNPYRYHSKTYLWGEITYTFATPELKKLNQLFDQLLRKYENELRLAQSQSRKTKSSLGSHALHWMTTLFRTAKGNFNLLVGSSFLANLRPSLAQITENSTFYTAVKIDTNNFSISITSGCATHDGGYALAGYIGEDSKPQEYKVLVIKFNSVGQHEWSKSFSISGYKQLGYSINCASDGNLIVTGQVFGFPGALSVSSVSYSFVVKLNTDGSVLSRKILGDNKSGGGACLVRSIKFTSDGGYIITGGSTFGGSSSSGGILFAKIDQNNNLAWAKQIDGVTSGQQNDGNYVIQTIDGGYILIGKTNHYGSAGGIVLYKFNSNGGFIWGKLIRSPYYYGRSIQQTKDGGYIVTGFRYVSGESTSKLILVRLDANGNKLWSKLFGLYYERGYFAHEAIDGGFIVGGETAIGGAGTCMLLAKVANNGELLWARILKNTLSNVIPSVRAFAGNIQPNGRIMIGGELYIANNNPTYFDAVLARFDEDGNIPGCDAIVDITTEFISESVNEDTTSVTPTINTITRDYINWAASASSSTTTVDKFCAGTDNQTSTTTRITQGVSTTTSAATSVSPATATSLSTTNNLVTTGYSSNPILQPTTSSVRATTGIFSTYRPPVNDTYFPTPAPMQRPATNNDSSLVYLWLLLPAALFLLICFYIFYRRRQNRRAYFFNQPVSEHELRVVELGPSNNTSVPMVRRAGDKSANVDEGLAARPNVFDLYAQI